MIASNLLLPLLLGAVGSIATVLPESYDVVWTQPGVNGSADSMPVGGGDIGLNVWYEKGTSCEPGLTLSTAN